MSSRRKRLEVGFHSSRSGTGLLVPDSAASRYAESRGGLAPDEQEGLAKLVERVRAEPPTEVGQADDLSRLRTRACHLGTLSLLVIFDRELHRRAAASNGEATPELWEHASVSHRVRSPTWEELVKVRAAVWGDDAEVLMVMPAARQYTNIHPFCFHLWLCVGGSRCPPTM